MNRTCPAAMDSFLLPVALDSLHRLAVQPVRDFPDGLQVASQRFLKQLSSDGTQVARIVASADFHPQRVSKRLLSVHGANRPAHGIPPFQTIEVSGKSVTEL